MPAMHMCSILVFFPYFPRILQTKTTSWITASLNGDFKLAEKPLKIQKSRRHPTKINEENFNNDLKKNLQIDINKTLQGNYSNYMETTKKTMDKDAPLTTKMKTKRDHNPWFNEDSQSLKLKRG